MRNGFTLIELLTVIILISVLVVVSFTSISYLTKEREGDVLELKLKTFYSSMSDYMDKKGSIYKEKTKYVYCLSLETFIDETDYKEDDFKEMYNVSDFSNSTIRISFDNPANFTVTVVPTAECSQGERVDTVGVVKSFGDATDDEILDMIEYKNGYLIAASSYVGEHTGYTPDKSASFMSNTLNYDVNKDYTVEQVVATSGANTIYIAMVDKDFNILNKYVVANYRNKSVDSVLNIDGDNIYGLIIDKSYDEHLSIQLNSSFELKNSKPLILPYNAEFENVIKIKNGFYISAEFDQNSRPGKESAPYGNDKIIIKLDNKGNIVWSLPFGSNGDDYQNSDNFIVGDDDSIYYTTIVENNDGDATGLSTSNNFTAIIKVDKNGNLLWKKGSELEFNSENEKYYIKYHNNKLYASTVEGFDDMENITIFNSNTGEISSTFSLGEYGSLLGQTAYNNELFCVFATSQNTGNFAGLNPEGDDQYYIVKKTLTGTLVKEIVSEGYLDDIDLRVDKNGLLLTYSTQSSPNGLNIKRIDPKTLDSIKSTVILNDNINSVNVYSFNTESILTFEADANTDDLSTFPNNGKYDEIITRIKW